MFNIFSNNKFSIFSGGFEYKDCWKKININMSMNNICNEITVGTLNFFENKLKLFKSSEDWKLKKGNPYFAKVNDEIISTGYIDKVGINHSADGSDIEFYMRDKTSDLVDCNYYSETENEFKDQKWIDIIKKLCLPFSITVKADPGVENDLNAIAEKDFNIDMGSNVADMIVEICIKLGILVNVNGNGELYLTRPTLINYSSDIITDTNIIDCSFASSLMERYSHYICKALIDSNVKVDVGSEQAWIELVKNGNYSNNKIIEDKTLQNRYRPIIIEGGQVNNIDECTKKSIYEANIRRAKSFVVSYTLEGWTEVNSGKVWKPNTLVKVQDYKIDINEEMLINSVNLSYDDSGFTTTLELVLKECYSLNEQALLLIKKGF